MKDQFIKIFFPAILLFFTAVFFNQCSHDESASLPQTVDFNFHIRPILVKNCYLCHGPDSSSREAELRLDIFEGATALREDGIQAVFPGHPQKSEMIRRIHADDPNEMMPPPESNLSLTEQEKALLEKWIAQGADWKPHWAFIPPEKPTLPQVKNKAEVANDIDAFILASLEDHQLSPMAMASKTTLIRRLAYLLTGLPPHPSDIEKFVADDRSEAYEKLVDQYIASPQFGERWARHWMDLVRYAETKGHEFDYPVQGAWQYRDYLIRAFNEDLPYPQLVKEHLAGDLLESPRWNTENGRNESRLGTAFFAMSEGKHSPVNLTIDESERIDNIIDVTTKTFQALTVSCARCHDHKFDPIPTTDYYALYGVMKSSRFSIQDADLGLEEVKDLEELQKIRGAIRKLLAEDWIGEEILPVQNARFHEEQEQNTTETDHKVIGDFRGKGLDGWQSEGLAFEHQTTLGNPLFHKNSGQLIDLSEGKASSRQINTGVVGALRSPDFTITKDFIGIRALGKQSSIRIIIDNFQLIQDPIYGELEIQVDQPDWYNYTVDVSPWKGHKAYIEIIPGYYERHFYKLPTEAYVEVSYALAYDSTWPDMPSPSQLNKNNLHQAVRHWMEDNSSAKDIQLINQALRQGNLKTDLPEVRKLHQLEQQLSRRFTDSSYFTGITDGFEINSPVFIRGNPLNPSEEVVHRRFLSSVPTKDSVFRSQGSGRKELAESIISPENPLTYRVMVNRIWHYLFGKGIVETVDNFGLQGKLPTHPELLDFLAINFQEEGGSLKKMVKYIVMSNTFRRAVVDDEALQKKDPEDLWLAGFPLRRLEAEAIRDGMLVASGSLDSSMYGPSVAVHLTDFMQGRGRPQASGPLDGDGRRSIYVEVRRNFLSPMMLAFDRPIPFSTFGKRNTTNVPAQSLMLMNDPFVAAQAEVMAKRVITQKELSLEERIQWIYAWSFARTAREEEVAQARAFIKNQAQLYQIQQDDVLESVDVWKDYCHTIFNMKEFIYLI
ncbi:PSD1 and planctomycete cytochrome C domain-containing protein [Catalinimonas niigatensis]|uniref:PSD1 and planctomycete cytochrome C domain-containing protein n=1 Tax=Catalinimonas niigatensis TaxID=1397264 RepID=UPI00266622AD|nr:PSD1 and planctomycete cytochrome C domain-containing protein [Catalinimonas niigatensis]WPP49987.1 PSD1 and planctomycete cytochrome C domain-containing protein [Catalinimonas niigatensis]